MLCKKISWRCHLTQNVEFFACHSIVTTCFYSSLKLTKTSNLLNSYNLWVCVCVSIIFIHACVCERIFSIYFSLYKNYLHIRFIHFSNLRKKGANCSFLRYHYSNAAMRKFVCEIEFGKIVLSQMFVWWYFTMIDFIFLKILGKEVFEKRDDCFEMFLSC